MNQTTKSIFIGVICFLIGAGALYAYSTISELKKENETLTAQQPTASASPTIADSPSATNSPTNPPIITATAEPAAQTGKVSGMLGYPSEGIPPLEIYAFKQGELTTYYSVKTIKNQQAFTISDIPAGKYLVVAYPQAGEGLSGGYTAAVACGLLASCTDHSLIPVTVTAGSTTSGIEVKDWYAPANTFPTKP